MVMRLVLRRQIDHGRGRGQAGVALPGGLSASAGAISRRLTRSPSRARPSSTAQ
jgi:hypothetical protein